MEEKNANKGKRSSQNVLHKTTAINNTGRTPDAEYGYQRTEADNTILQSDWT